MSVLLEPGTDYTERLRRRVVKRVAKDARRDRTERNRLEPVLRDEVEAGAVAAAQRTRVEDLAIGRSRRDHADDVYKVGESQIMVRRVRKNAQYTVYGTSSRDYAQRLRLDSLADTGSAGRLRE